MKRDIYKKLLEWKESNDRKPLILKGARQVGKTYILNEFGNTEYKNTAYFNFEEDPNLKDLFQGRIQVNSIIQKLSIYSESTIEPDKTLIIFDEIQNSPETLNSLKYFNENANQYHIATAGSLLGIKVGQSAPFPVGKVNFLDLFPFSFQEFLEGIGKSQLRSYLRSKMDFQPIESIFHADLSDLLRMYLYIGGMPEVILKYKAEGDLSKIRKVQTDILSAYLFDFSKYASKTESIKITNIWNAIPGQLAKENKKFMFSGISKNSRFRDYVEALQWLVDAGLIYKSYNIKTPKLPLSGYRDENVFKIFLFDVGLLSAMLGLSQRTIMDRNRLFSEYNGAFTECFIAQELKASHQTDLYYWTSKNTAEVDFLFQSQERIIPLEVKSGFNRRKKSLKVYTDKYSPVQIARAGLMNFKHDGNLRNYPLYGISLFPLD